MEQHNQHIDRIIKEKFENFAPVPPESVWQGIEASLDAPQTTGFFTGTVRWIFYGAAVAIILLLGWLLLSNGNQTAVNKYRQTVVSEQNVAPSSQSGIDYQEKRQSGLKKEEKGSVSITTANQSGLQSDNTESPVLSNDNNTTVTKQVGGTLLGKQDKKFSYTTTISNNSGQTVTSERQVQLNSLNSLMLRNTVFVTGSGSLLPLNTPVYSNESKNKKASRWRAGIFMSPEFTINTIDSLRVLQAYSLNADFRYTAENGLFLKLGTGMQYARDRYFVHVRFKSWDYLGSYDDVYEVTFDTTSGTPVPIYHTRKVDVYDSILHLNVSEATSRYLYLQFPVVAGYTGHLTGSWNWYVYGGPAINFLIWQTSDYPQVPENSNIVSYTSSIYKRNSVVYQLWLGAGFEYMLNDNINFVLEPGFRYYFNPVYKDFYKKQSLSAFTMRFGLTFKL